VSEKKERGSLREGEVRAKSIAESGGLSLGERGKNPYCFLESGRKATGEWGYKKKSHRGGKGKETGSEKASDNRQLRGDRGDKHRGQALSVCQIAAIVRLRKLEEHPGEEGRVLKKEEE